MFSPTLLNDGTFIYNKDIALEHLQSLGYTEELLREITPIDLSSYILRKDVDNWELFADGLHTNLMAMAEEISAICDNLASGKGGTKKQYAQKIENILSQYL